MKTEYRIILTALFDTAEERDKAYVYQVVTVTAKAAVAKRADMLKDEYQIQDASTVSEKVI